MNDKSNEINKTLRIIIIVLLFVAGTLIGYIAAKEKLFETNNNEINKKTEIVGEIEITDSNIIKILKDKHIQMDNYPYINIYNNLSSADLKIEEKLGLVLWTLPGYGNIGNSDDFAGKVEKNMVCWDSAEQDCDDSYNVDEDGNYYYYTIDEVKKPYKELFGEELNITELLDYIVVSDEYLYTYEPNVNAFFLGNNYTMGCQRYDIWHDYKYSEDNQHAYVYTVVAFEDSCHSGLYKTPEDVWPEWDSDYVHDEDGNVLYAKSDILLGQEEEILSNYRDNNINTYDAYQDILQKYADKLDKFRITFRKDGDNFIFEKVEKIVEENSNNNEINKEPEIVGEREITDNKKIEQLNKKMNVDDRFKLDVYSYFGIDEFTGDCDDHVYTSITKYSEDKDYAYVYVIAGFGNECRTGLYKDLNDPWDCEKECNLISGQEEIEFDKADNGKTIANIVKNHANELNKYRIIFKKDGDNFVFERVELI